MKIIRNFAVAMLVTAVMLPVAAFAKEDSGVGFHLGAKIKSFFNLSNFGIKAELASKSGGLKDAEVRNQLKIDLQERNEEKKQQQIELRTEFKAEVKASKSQGQENGRGKGLLNPIRNWFITLFTSHIIKGEVTANNLNSEGVGTIIVQDNNEISYTVTANEDTSLIGRNPFTQQDPAELESGDRVQIFGNVSSTSIQADIIRDLTVSNDSEEDED